MTRGETRKTLRRFRCTFPRFYQDISSKEVEEVLDEWEKAFSDTDYEAVSIAVDKYLKIGKYPPTIADIWEIVEELTRKIERFVKTGEKDGEPVGRWIEVPYYKLEEFDRKRKMEGNAQ